LVDVSPREVVGACEVVELVAEVSVAVVEVDVEEQLSECDGDNYQHAFVEERFRSASWGGKRRRGGGHKGVKNSRSEEKMCNECVRGITGARFEKRRVAERLTGWPLRAGRTVI
jgi:hypothetical protein